MAWVTALQFVALFSMQSSASQLLFQLTLEDGGAAAPLQAPEGFQVLLQFDIAEPPVGSGVFWTDGSSGTYDFTSVNELQFGQFSDHLTDGIDQLLFIEMLSAGGGGGGSGNFESGWGFGTPDLAGSDIDLIRLIVHDFHIAPYVSPIAGNGLQWETHFTWEFWGTPVPEPATAALFFLALAASRARGRRSV